ncbi:hypothetical protein BGZ65_007956 [Modicella reniformis]|uniref:F-box domain-containing protein n=1 Tax=Modicella reniformis TaxID=1440133 RepID=A0A9P6M863_9FUNG|nr:hypothetical protein BGZ65_007956 [Modicella reniformis]
MFDLLELDEVICQQLKRQDLAQCARVNKKWNRVVTPHLWSNMTNLSEDRQMDFQIMIREDYLYEQQRLQLQEGDLGMEQHVQEHRLSPALSTLEKYGPWIRRLPYPGDLLSILHSPEEKKPAAHELIHHLYKRCPFLDVQELSITEGALSSNDKLRTIEEYLLRHARDLRVYCCSKMEPRRLKYLLKRCPNKEKLSLQVKVSNTEDAKEDWAVDQTVDESDDWVQLKEVRLYSCEGGSKEFWLWLLKRLSHIRRLEFWPRDEVVAECLAEVMLTDMAELDEIHLIHDIYIAADLPDDLVAALLSGSRKGWKVVKAKFMWDVGEVIMEALANHFPTLEVFDVNFCEDYMFNDLVRVLSSSPNLHTLITIDDNWLLRCQNPHLEAVKFIDRDANTGLLKAWKCETTLKVLKLKIRGIPRPDLEGDGVVGEEYPGQGHEIQRPVYDRLARFTNLETLWLGEYRWLDQWDCLEMSLESGLYKLKGLKALKELNVWCMKTKIGLEEVQWMTENWPRLNAINGIDRGFSDDNDRAVRWLQEYHPKIRLQ